MDGGGGGGGYRGGGGGGRNNYHGRGGGGHQHKRKFQGGGGSHDQRYSHQRRDADEGGDGTRPLLAKLIKCADVPRVSFFFFFLRERKIGSATGDRRCRRFPLRRRLVAASTSSLTPFPLSSKQQQQPQGAAPPEEEVLAVAKELRRELDGPREETVRLFYLFLYLSLFRPLLFLLTLLCPPSLSQNSFNSSAAFSSTAVSRSPTRPPSTPRSPGPSTCGSLGSARFWQKTPAQPSRPPPRRLLLLLPRARPRAPAEAATGTACV